MLTLPNLISLSRLPLAFLFLIPSPTIRAITVGLALLSDGLDGFIARRYQMKSQWGALLDPLTDKFFVFFVMTVLLSESKLHLWQAFAMACRDISVILFGIYLGLKGYWNTYQFRAIWCGKIITCMQLLVLFGLVFNITFSSTIYASFIVIGSLALVELYYSFHVESKC